MNVFDLSKGDIVSCKIEEKFIPEGRIQVEKGAYYICQNHKRGSSCSDKMGYDHSWIVYSPERKDNTGDPAKSLKAHKVINVKVLNKEYRFCFNF